MAKKSIGGLWKELRELEREHDRIGVELAEAERVVAKRAALLSGGKLTEAAKFRLTTRQSTTLTHIKAKKILLEGHRCNIDLIKDRIRALGGTL